MTTLNRAIDDLEEHIRTQNENLAEIHRNYEEDKAKREKNAENFCQGKTAEELKEWLADQLVAYNSWKEADYDTLIRLVMDVYDE